MGNYIWCVIVCICGYNRTIMASNILYITLDKAGIPHPFRRWLYVYELSEMHSCYFALYSGSPWATLFKINNSQSAIPIDLWCCWSKMLSAVFLNFLSVCLTYISPLIKLKGTQMLLLCTFIIHIVSKQTNFWDSTLGFSTWFPSFYLQYFWVEEARNMWLEYRKA